MVLGVRLVNCTFSTFRQSKVLSEGERTSSFCSLTESEYLAPEVILQRDYDCSVDW